MASGLAYVGHLRFPAGLRLDDIDRVFLNQPLKPGREHDIEDWLTYVLIEIHCQDMAFAETGGAGQTPQSARWQEIGQQYAG